MSIKQVTLVIALFTLVATPTSLAHHSVAVNFDQSNDVTVEGILQEITWRNPHSHFKVNVTNEDGSQLQWLVEMGAINTMRRKGFETELFEVGNPISITGWPGVRGRTLYLLETILHDGTELICAGASCDRER